MQVLNMLTTSMNFHVHHSDSEQHLDHLRRRSIDNNKYSPGPKFLSLLSLAAELCEEK